MRIGKRSTQSGIRVNRAQRLATSRTIRVHRRWQVAFTVALAAAAGVIALPTAFATPPSCDSGIGVSMNATVIAPSNPQPTIVAARVGDTIDYRVIVQLFSTQCPLTNGT